jgi:uncharacterized integral membrane protein (TIGR00698 family)
MGAARRAPVLPLVPGLLVALVFAWAAIELAALPFFRDQLHFGALLLVILLGMTWRALLPVPGWALPGIETAKKPIAEIGLPALAVVSIGTLVALWAGWWLAKAIGIDHKMGLLLGVGGAICGASAVVAADTVVQGEKKDSALAISVITLLGTIGILLYPQVYAPLFDADAFGYGVWAGASLHETAQVVAAGDAIGAESKEVATVVKLVRICWLAPIVFYLGWSLRRHHEKAGEAKVSLVPWFLVMFVAFAALNSFGLIPQEGALGVDNLKTFGSWLMVVGMAGVGLETSVKDLLRAGPRPVLVGALQWLLLAALTYGLILLFLP